MPKKYNRNEIIKRLQTEIADERSILVVGTGNGLSARCAEAGGADLAVVYNSGYFRLNGLPSLVGTLPIGDANEIMFRLGRESIVPTKRNIPVMAGVFGSDPVRDPEFILDAVESIGFSGIINFPTVGRHTGSRYARDLENAGLGFECEVDLMRRARKRDLFTLAYVYNPADAILMVDAGVDVIVGHMGLTQGGDIGALETINISAAATALEEIFDAALSHRKDVILLSHGGPISTPEEAEFVNRNTKAVGFVAASSFERIPVEIALTGACRAFKSIRQS